MFEDWRPIFFDKYSCNGNVVYAGDGDIEIKGRLKIAEANTRIDFWAACPADYRQSYSGSGLPFANPDMAYENTPNRGTVMADQNGEFRFRVKIPNSYYNGLGTIYQKPHVQMKISNSKFKNIHSIDISEGVPFRLLTYPPPPGKNPRCSPLFYNYRYKQPIRTQEQILIDSGYPKKNKMPENFWGLAVPHP